MKNYLITGATSSSGKALTKKIAENSENKLILVSRSYDESLDKLSNNNIKYFSGIDLLKFKESKQILSEIDTFFSEEFALIHLAGNFWEHYPFLSVDLDFAIKMMNSHYGTLYTVCQETIPIMAKKGGGRIITYSCNATDYNFPNMLPFTAAKAAVEATIKCIAHEHSKDKIVANAIAISSLKTEANKKSKPYGDYEHYLSLEELALTTLEIINLKHSIVNGSVIKCFEYSESYYNEGYFTRIKQK